MKKKLHQFKISLYLHKKKIAACMAVILLALSALGIGLVGMQQENEKAVAEKDIDQKEDIVGKKIAKAEIPKKNVSEKKEEEKQVEQKTDAPQTAETKQPTQQITSSETTTGDSGNIGEVNKTPVGNAGNGNSQQVHTHNYNIPVYTQQWVVDQAAWTETVSEPVYEMVEIAVGNQSGLEITGIDPNEYLLNNANGDTGWHSEWVQRQTGTNTYSINHPEQGHYESVVTGYQCGCGAIQ